jgi:hypothetical protein
VRERVVSMIAPAGSCARARVPIATKRPRAISVACTMLEVAGRLAIATMFVRSGFIGEPRR